MTPEKFASSAAAMATLLVAACSSGTPAAAPTSTPASPSAAAPAQGTPAVSLLDAAFVDGDGALVTELFNDFRSMPLMVRLDAQTSGDATVDVVVRQDKKTVGKKTLTTVGPTPRALLMFSKGFASCTSVTVDVTVTDKGKTATGSANVTSMCGE
jgi:hypothetical protein